MGLANQGDWPRVAAIVPRLPRAGGDAVQRRGQGHELQQSVEWLRAQFAVIEVIILALVLLGILNNVSTGVLDSEHEIGCLKANGDAPSDVRHDHA